MNNLTQILSVKYLSVIMKDATEIFWHSESFYKEVQPLLVKFFEDHESDEDISPSTIHSDLRSAPLENHLTAFTVATLAAYGQVALDLQRTSLALSFCEEGLAYTPMDIFLQEVMCKARSRLGLTNYSYEDTVEWLKGAFCTKPFTHIETLNDNQFYRCCSTWLPVPIGSFDSPDLESVLNSDRSNAIKNSILDGSFRYCSKLYCLNIVQRTLPSREAGIASIKGMSSRPETVTLCHDRSCNLSCPSCRRELITTPKSEQENLSRIAKTFIEPIMHSAKLVTVTNSGDPFASIHFRRLLKDYCQNTEVPVRRLNIWTNAVLFDEKAWEEIGLRGHVKVVTVSIDAAVESTYAIVRRGGDFNRLKKNLEFIGRLRATGEIEHFTAMFIVQKRNFREMAAFVEMCESIHVDKIYFSQLQNWGAYDLDEFADNCVTNQSHPMHQELLDVLQDPIFNRESVYLANLGMFMPRADERVDMTSAA